MCFLYGYGESALAVLYEKTSTWVGWYNLSKDMCEIVVLSVDVDK